VCRDGLFPERRPKSPVSIALPAHDGTLSLLPLRTFSGRDVGTFLTAEAIITLRPLLPADTLLCAVATGDRASFTALYTLTSARVHTVIRNVLIDASQSEEVTQEVFLEVWQLAHRYVPAIASATTWMLSIAHRRAIDRVRASQSNRARDLKIGIRNHPDPVDVVVEEAEIRVQHEQAKRALHCLTPIQLEAVHLAYWKGFTSAEISAKLGIKRSTASSGLRDGLLRLRQEMETA